MRSVVLLILFSTFSMSCSSYFKRKSCEKVNWYDHGYKVAMSGKRLTGDSLYNECVKVEAEISHSDVDVGWKAGRKMYCSADGAYQKGQSGEKYSFEYCDAARGAKTRAAYKKGVNEFCRPKKAYSFGARGGVYKKVCSPEQEIQWVPEFRRGRVVFLKGEILNKRQNIAQINSEVMDLENERHDILRKMSALPVSRVATTERKYDPATKSYRTVKKVSEGDETKQLRQDLSRQADRVTRKVKDARKRQSSIRSEIHKMEREIGALK